MLKPWRQVVHPHEDVREGRFQESEFAADLTSVVRGDAPREYQDASVFFERTYITEGMGLLLDSVIRRLSGRGGDPVVQLQTSFGGGKTHTMLAVWHLAKQAYPPAQLAGVGPLLDKAGVSSIPPARVAVLDGNQLSLSQPQKYGSVEVRTLWGELAWQLGGEQGFALVAQADRDGTSPGKAALSELFTLVGPSIILMDEMVAYLRQFEPGRRYHGGTFEVCLSFIQALTEVVTSTPRTMLFASLPESLVEIGEVFGHQALGSLQKYFGRVEAVWKPVATEEAFEIVRRRLFSTIVDESARDATCNAFMELYHQGGAQFPHEVRETAYLERLRKSYPIHPEVFTRLYEDWASLERFQRTRGVLRLMALVISQLWSDGDQSALIMPSSIPLHASQVRNELVKYLPQGWDPVIEREVDGAQSIPRTIDTQLPALGQQSAARSVARTIFLGSAPSTGQRLRGLGPERIRLGCAQPGNSVGHYDDALRRLLDKLHYLYTQQNNYWFDLQPNLRREVEDRAQRLHTHDLIAELKQRLERLVRATAFDGIHVFTPHSDLPDDASLRLVIIDPKSPHIQNNQDSLALRLAHATLKNRGTSPRRFPHRLVFLAADFDYAGRLLEDTRRLLAWESILRDTAALNLDQLQIVDAKQNRDRAQQQLETSLRQAYVWALTPEQDLPPAGPPAALRWHEQRLTQHNAPLGDDLVRALKAEELIIEQWSPKFLHGRLARLYWQQEPHVSTAKLWEDLCAYHYMPRLLSRDTLLQTIRAGVESADFFGWAAAVGEEGAYEGVVFAQPGSPTIDAASVLIQPATLLKQGEEKHRRAVELFAAQLRDAIRAYAAKLHIDESIWLASLHTSIDELTLASLGQRTPQAVAADLKLRWQRLHDIEISEISEASEASGFDHLSPNPGPLIAAQPEAERPTTEFFLSVPLDPLKGSMTAADIFNEIIDNLRAAKGTQLDLYFEIRAHRPEGFDEQTQRTIRENLKTLKLPDGHFSKS